MSNKFSCALWFKNSLGPTPISYSIKQRFPQNTKGFFYYNVPPPHSPPTMGDLRFRITSSSDPSSFNDGSDLIHGLGHTPWSLPLLNMAKAESYIQLCEQLVAEDLISQELLDRCHLIWKNSPVSADRACRPLHFLYRLDQPILLNFHYETHTFRLWIVGKEEFSLWTPKHPYYRRFLTGMQVLFPIL